jgi:hypothetical protein
MRRKPAERPWQVSVTRLAGMTVAFPLLDENEDVRTIKRKWQTLKIRGKLHLILAIDPWSKKIVIADEAVNLKEKR